MDLKVIIQQRNFITHKMQELLTNISFRREFEKGDEVITHNIRKSKEFPEKKTHTYPYTVLEVKASLLSA